MAHDVFISYSSKDKPTADAVCNGLETVGIRCWMAPRDILPGQQWASAIIEAIHASKLMVLVLSTNANTSEQVLREVERSVHRAIPIIPFRIEEFELASAFEYYLSVPHWLDAMTGPLEDHIERLVHTAQVLIEQRAVATPAPAAPADAAAHSPESLALAELVRPDAGHLAEGGVASPPPRELPAPVAAPVTPPNVAPSPLSLAAPTPAGVSRPPWLWAAPVVALVLAAGVFAAVRLLPVLTPAPPTTVPAPPVVTIVPTVAPPATPPPQIANASVQVNSNPEGATILVNGQPAGRAPQPLSLQPGQYQLTLQAATYRDWSQTIEVTEGQRLPVQGILEPLPPLEVLEITERVMGRDAAVDTGRIVRVRAPSDTFQVSDVLNAVVYFRPKTYQIRDISYNVTHRWQIAGQPDPGVVTGSPRASRDEPLLFTHACALAAQLDATGSNTPLTLEVLVDGQSVARFNFRISGGVLANAPRDPGEACDRTRLPTVVVVLPDGLFADS